MVSEKGLGKCNSGWGSKRIVTQHKNKAIISDTSEYKGASYDEDRFLERDVATWCTDDMGPVLRIQR